MDEIDFKRYSATLWGSGELEIWNDDDVSIMLEPHEALVFSAWLAGTLAQRREKADNGETESMRG